MIKDTNETILYLVMPAYNEQDNIESVVRAWYPLLEDKHPDSALVIADEGSQDKTHEILLSMQKEFPKLKILPTRYRQHGPKLISLYQYAIDQDADYIFQTDSDGQTDPAEFETFWTMRDQYDCILGNRTDRQDGKSRAMVERVVCLLLRLYYGIDVPDANAPFRLIKTDVMKKYLPLFKENYNLPNILLCACFSRYGEDLAFVPITFEPRKKGTNSINLKKITGIGLQSLKDFYQYKKEMKQRFE